MLQVKGQLGKFYSEIDVQRIEHLPFRTEAHARDDFERDYSRIVHSAAFRRLQAKTQVIGIGEGDFHRTRLTHSMEVAQIARGITLSLNEKSEVLRQIDGKIDSSLIEAAALAHDFGHPPFGHQGERALNDRMKGVGGFEGNAQTFRILTRLERHTGLNLTRSTLLAILKYPILYENAVDLESYRGNDSKPPKTSVYSDDKGIFEWLTAEFTKEERIFLMETEEKAPNKHLKTKNKTLECSIIEIADDIAYATHDLEDALKLDLIKIEDVLDVLNKYIEIPYMVQPVDNFTASLKGNFPHLVKEATADLISILISNVQIAVREQFNSPRIRYVAYLPDELSQLINDLNTKLIKEKVINLQQVQTVEWKGGQLIKKLFDAFYEHPNLLPSLERSQIIAESKSRVVCDYIAGMTDSFAMRMYSRLFESRESRLFDI